MIASCLDVIPVRCGQRSRKLNQRTM